MDEQTMKQFFQDCTESMCSPDLSPHEVATRYKVSLDTVYIVAMDQEMHDKWTKEMHGDVDDN